MSVITYPLNGIDYDAENAEIYLCTRISGVFSAEGHFSASVTGDREVTVSPGLAWIQNTEYHGKAVYNDSPVALQVPVADGGLPRIDRIVLRFDKGQNASSIVLKQGTPASSPVPPELSRTELNYELGLYVINVGASSVVVSDGDIESTILDEEVCGIMRDAVTGIPTQDLYNEFYAWYQDIQNDAENTYENFVKRVQDTADTFEKDTEESYRLFFETLTNYETNYREEFEEWFESIKDTLSGDVAGNLEIEIESLQEELDQLKADIVAGMVMTAILSEDDQNITTEDGENIMATRTFH